MSARPAATRIRLVVTDIDGTLLDPDKRLTERTVAAAHALRDAGVALCLVSSRPTRAMLGLRRALGVETPLAGFNGGEILDARGDAVERLLLAEAAARRAVAMLGARGIDAWVFADGEWHVTDPDGAYVPLERRTLGYPPRVVADFEAVIGRANKVLGSTRNAAGLAAARNALGEALGEDAAAHLSQEYYLDVTHPRARKDRALERLAALAGVAAAEVAALGDMPNDVPMLRAAGLAVAMGNAPEAVRAEADRVAPDNAHEGWARAVEDFILPLAPGRGPDERGAPRGVS